MGDSKTRLLATAAMLAAGALSSPAWAQQAGTAPAQTQAGEQQSTMGELIVTAERREQRLQDVAAVVTAVNQVALQREDVKQLSDYLTLVPGVDYNLGQGPTGARGRQTVGIRGVERTGGLEVTSIGYYIDETSIDVANPRIFDLDRIEVLSGPQGTLYGASSMGGTIRLITKQPNVSQASFETDLRGFDTDHGGFGEVVNQMANLPIVQDKIALRLDGSYEFDPGYVDNYSRTGPRLQKNVNGTTAQEDRVALLITPTDRLEITPSFYYHWLNLAQEPYQVGGVAGFPAYANQTFHTTQSDESFTLAGLNIRYDLGWMNFVSQTSYYHFASESNEDLTLSFASLTGFYPVGIHSTTFERKFSEEDRLVSKLSGPFQFVVGVYYDNVDRPFTSNSLTPGLNAAFAAHGVKLKLPTTPAGDNYYNVISTNNQSQVAGYGDGTLTVWKKLDLNVGLRVFKFTSSNANTFNGFLFQNLPPIVPGHATETGVDPKFNLTWRQSHDLLFYVTVDRGFRPGNANIPLPSACGASLIAAGITPPGPDSFQSDSLWNYEGGVKSAWFSNRLTANVTAFRMDWSNIQVVVPLPSCKISGYVVNAGNAVSQGVEWQLAAHPIEGLTLSYEGAYDDAHLTTGSKELAAHAGTRLLDTPHWSMSGAADYGFPLGDYRGYAHADLRYRGSTELFFSGLNPSQALTQVDLRVGVLGHRPGLNWDAALYVDNVTNTDPILSYTARAALGGFQFESVTPRTIGLNLTLNY